MPRPAVEWFAEQMEKKLKRDDESKTPWETQADSMKNFYRGLVDEVLELHAAMCACMDAPTPEAAHAVVMEAADVGNFAMMIAALHNRSMMALNRGKTKERV